MNACQFSSVSQSTAAAAAAPCESTQATPSRDKIYQAAAPLLQNQTIAMNDTPFPSCEDVLPMLMTIIKKVLIFVDHQKLRCILTQSKMPECYLDFLHDMIRQGTFDTTMELKTKNIFSSANGQIIQKVISEHITRENTVLEVGAGKLVTNDSTASFLTGYFPVELLEHLHVTYTDINPMYKESAGNGVRYELADLVTLNTTFAPNSFDHIVSSNVFDTLKKTDLDKALNEAYAVLKPGGKLFLFSVIEPLHNVLFTTYTSDNNTVVFPLAGHDGHPLGIQMISRDDLLNWLEDTKFDHRLSTQRNFFECYLQLTAYQREVLIIAMLEDRKLTRAYSEFFKGLFSNVRIVYNKEFFESNLQTGLRQAGFDITDFNIKELQSNINSSQLELDTDNLDNDFEYNLGHTSYKQSSGIPNNVTVLRTKIHVIVAQKPLGWQCVVS